MFVAINFDEVRKDFRIKPPPFGKRGQGGFDLKLYR